MRHDAKVAIPADISSNRKNDPFLTCHTCHLTYRNLTFLGVFSIQKSLKITNGSKFRLENQLKILKIRLENLEKLENPLASKMTRPDNSKQCIYM